jgi:hypothetical protein
MDEKMQRLIEAIQKASPVVWHAAYRQVRIESIELAIGIILFTCFSRWLFKESERMRKNNTEEWIFVRAGAWLSGFIVIPCSACLFEYLLNPTYAAIKELKGLL